MKNILSKLHIFLLIIVFISCSNNQNLKTKVPYAEEISTQIDRGLVVFDNKRDAFLTWRKLSGDSGDYKIWRRTISSDKDIIDLIDSTSHTYYRDLDFKESRLGKYFVSVGDYRPKEDDYKLIEKNTIIYSGENALSFDLEEDYKQARVVTGDLTGDGELEIIINYSSMSDVDPFEDAWMKSTDIITVAAFKRNGKLIWKKDLSWGIEAGTFYIPVVVWDLDADGKSEIILKTNKSDDPQNYEEEYLTILSGENGEVLREARWPSPVTDRYNSNSRNYIVVAHLDGKNPTILAARGTYFAQVLYAFDSSLNKVWDRVIGEDIESRFENKYLKKIWRRISNDRSRGSHVLPVADIDDNGTEEIIWGEHCITIDGEDLWEVDEKIPYVGHLDIVYSADMIPEIPGKETYYCREGWKGKEDNIGMLLVDKRGNTIWGNWGFTHIDGGWASKVISDSEEWQMFGFDVEKKDWVPGQLSYKNPSQHLFNSKGKLLSNPDSSWIKSFTVDWEGDSIKEICTRSGEVKRYNGEILSNVGPGLLWGGDLYGDHREELVVAPKDGKVYIIFNTSDLKEIPQITKQADRQYKNDLSRTAMQYNVIPTESGYIPKSD